MKYTICILLYCTLFLVNSVHSLQGGLPAILGAHPSHALVLVNDLPHGGTIINVNHVVTSCSVVLDRTNNHLRAVGQFTVRAGSIAFAGGFTTTVTAVFPHPECDPWILTNDVAVIRTTTNFPFNVNIPNPDVAPALFNERVIADGSNCVVVGFNAPVAGVAPLQQLSQSISNRDTVCNLGGVHNGRVLETMFCAGGVGAGSGICDSTIGGGIYCFGNFTGIASSGAGCGAANSPGIYTQVRHHITWINTQLTRTQIPQAGVTPQPGVSAGILSTVTSSFLICLAILSTIV